jgi:hypothetical protein
LTFELAGGRFFKDGKTEVLGLGDGERFEEFRRIEGLNDDARDGLAAGGAGGERRVVRRLAMIEALAAEAAGSLFGSVAVDGHDCRE